MFQKDFIFVVNAFLKQYRHHNFGSR